MKKAWYIFTALAVLAVIAFVAWRQQQSMLAGLPARTVCQSLEEARIAAGASSFAVLGTGSMAPFIPAAPDGAEPTKTVVAYAVPSGAGYDQIRKGDLVVYYAGWAKGLVIHQAAQQDSGGWIMSGLHNRVSESFARVTQADFRAVVGHVYIW